VRDELAMSICKPMEALMETSYGRTNRDWRAQQSKGAVDDVEIGSNWVRD
jgi:hypothetical protein